MSAGKLFHSLDRRFIAAATLLWVGWAVVHGQDPRLKLDHLDKLAAKAEETVDVTLDESMLRLASGFLSDKRSHEEGRAKELVGGLKGVYVRSYKFDEAGAYTEQDIETIRKQLTTPAWSKIVTVRNRKKGNGDNVDVYIMPEGKVAKGLAVLVAGATELTVVNIVGPIDLEKLSELEGKYGIPELQLEKPDEPKKEKKP
jgi:hypothetical protein